GSPMPATGPADVGMAACSHAVAGPLVPARPGFRELVSVWPATGEPTVVRAVFPGSASFKPAVDRMTGRSRTRRPDPRPPASTQAHQPHQPHRPARAPGPPCPRSSPLAHPHYLDGQLIPEGTCYAYSPHRRD